MQTQTHRQAGATANGALTLHDLDRMSGPELQRIMDTGHPLDPEALVDKQYLGIDLSLPAPAHKLLWKNFRKTFHRDPATGIIRGWNVRMEQTGYEPDSPRIPMMDKHGEDMSFGHYHLKSGEGVHFPNGYTCPHFLDYGCAGNTFTDLGRLGYTPLVAVNEGSSDLLLGWEIFKVGPLFLPMKLYWGLQLDGPLERVVPPPTS